jgi:hypothetical protein
MVAPRRNVTVPAFTVLELVTVAVRTNPWAVVEGLILLARVVVVLASELVVNVSDQLVMELAAPAVPVSS